MKNIFPLLDWFSVHKRELPWRKNRTFYRVWVSEVMLQQTQVSKVIPFYEKFMNRFPQLEVLATASFDEVLKYWEGLGYYSRARNLHKAANYILESFGGSFPSEYDEIIKIPGFGPYTTAAVLSLVYHKPYAVVDGNVIRVISRIFAISDDMRKEKNKKKIQKIVDELIPHKNPSDFNEALMELGSEICSPKNFLCRKCPISSECSAFGMKKVADFPVKSRIKKIPEKKREIIVFLKDNFLLIEKRSIDQMLGGLWKFPDRKEKKGEKIALVKHTYSHFKLKLNVFVVHENPQEILENQKLISVKNIDDFAFDTASRKVLKLLLQ